jgi:hypothetical protein
MWATGWTECVPLWRAKRRSPPSWHDPVLVVLQQRGLDHERGYVDELMMLAAPLPPQ